jgi:D-3-phosphoglycerate dehydrogenase / 2-oxoglutarate reductase
MLSLRQCLIIDPLHESIFEMLQHIGWRGIDVSDKAIEEIKPLINNYEGLFVRTRTRVDKKLLGNKPLIKFVARAGAGVDNIDLDFLTEHNIPIVHASEGNRDAVGEYTIGALLSLLRNIPRADAEVRNTVWLREENRGVELMGKTIGIIGYGNMGQAFAKRLSGFNCTVLAYDKYKRNFSNGYATEVTFNKLVEESEIVSLHIPLMQETVGMVNDRFINSFLKPIVLVNTARGEIVQLKAVVEGLKSKKIRGLVLDVLENENPNTFSAEQKETFSYLTKQSNVVLTPHIAGWTHESAIKINSVLIEKLKLLGL